MPKDRGPDYIPLVEAYEMYGRRPVDRLRGKAGAGAEPSAAVLTEATWEDDGHTAIYLLRSELTTHFDKPTLRRGGEQVDAG